MPLTRKAVVFTTDPDFLRRVETLLRRHSYQVVVWEQGQGVAGLVSRQIPVPDVVIVADFSEGSRQGAGWISAIRPSRQIPILGLVGPFEDAYAQPQRAMSHAGATLAMSVPPDNTQLIDAVEWVQRLAL